MSTSLSGGHQCLNVFSDARYIIAIRVATAASEFEPPTPLWRAPAQYPKRIRYR
jgi:hypothetical protein